MKRTATIFFALVYLMSTSGAVWSNFYCCGKWKETYFFKSKELSKDCRGNKKGPGCCNTKTFSFKVKDNHTPSTQVKANSADVTKFFSPTFISLFNSQHVSSETYSFAFLHAPPFISKQPVYLAVCNFRI